MDDNSDLAKRALIRLQGEDTISLLERLVTNDTTDWDAGEARYGALLTPQGKVIADFVAARTNDGVDLNVAESAAADLEKRLKMFRLRADVDINRSGDAELPYGPDADRMMAIRAVQGLDFGSADVFPADINMDRHGGVALNKGCFVGQEVVSRMHRRGKIRKRTLLVRGEGLEKGASVMAGGPLGEITSTCEGLGLARVRIDRLVKAEAAGTPIHVNDKAVTLEKPDWLEAEMAAQMANE